MIVTVSRQLGSGGDVIAARVAAALGLNLVTREHVYRAAAAAGVPVDLLHKLMYEGQRSLATDIVDSLGAPTTLSRSAQADASPLLGAFAPMLPPVAVSLEEGARSVGLVIREIAGRGDVLILGQGGQMWLAGYKGACHVQLVAPLALRVARVAERERITTGAARRRVKASDQARHDSLARYHNVDWLDPLLYHLVLNTGQTSLDAAVSLIVHAGQAVALAA
jgi:cytidylate kinase